MAIHRTSFYFCVSQGMLAAVTNNSKISMVSQNKDTSLVYVIQEKWVSRNTIIPISRMSASRFIQQTQGRRHERYLKILEKGNTSYCVFYIFQILMHILFMMLNMILSEKHAKKSDTKRYSLYGFTYRNSMAWQK